MTGSRAISSWTIGNAIVGWTQREDGTTYGVGATRYCALTDEWDASETLDTSPDTALAVAETAKDPSDWGF